MARFTRLPLLPLFLIAVALGLSGCGEDAATNAPSAATTSPTGNVTATSTAQPEDSSDGDTSSANSDLQENMAVVTVGELRYEFNMSGICIALFGTVGGTGFATDGSGVRLEIDIPPEDWETSDDGWEAPYVRIDDDVNDLDWRAGGLVVDSMPAIDPGMSQVDEFVNKGSSASGTATFVELFRVFRGEEPEPVEGTFEIRCAA